MRNFGQHTHTSTDLISKQKSSPDSPSGRVNEKAFRVEWWCARRRADTGLFWCGVIAVVWCAVAHPTGMPFSRRREPVGLVGYGSPLSRV